jgi:hypothetical protein
MGNSKKFLKEYFNMVAKQPMGGAHNPYKLTGKITAKKGKAVMKKKK